MKVLILGSTGIIGQHMAQQTPGNVDAVFARRIDCDLTDCVTTGDVLLHHRPDVIVNLAGESNTDIVERNQARTEFINSFVPEWLAAWCSHHRRTRLIHISTQAVFSGNRPTYRADQRPFPINAYGRQKKRAEDAIMLTRCDWQIIRPTFVLGVRPDPTTGRENPIEAMLKGQRKQVDDRWFSPSFAPDVAKVIWQEAVNPSGRSFVHAGIPMRCSRFSIAKSLGLDVQPVSHEDFPGIAPRPRDTTYAESDHSMSFEAGIADCLSRWEVRETVAA